MIVPPPCNFDRGKPFYPLVSNYVCQLVGVVELVMRGIAGPRRLDEMVESAIARAHALRIPETDPSVLRKHFQKITASPWQLRSEMLDNNIGLPVDVIASEIAENFALLMSDLVSTAAGTALVMAHEISKDMSWRTDGPPLWEFLFHCRNAVAHGGRFFFRNDQPHHPAQWGSFELTRALQGTPLFKKNGKDGGMLSPGDPIRLLWDIEQAYPIPRPSP